MSVGKQSQEASECGQGPRYLDLSSELQKVGFLGMFLFDQGLRCPLWQEIVQVSLCGLIHL